MVHPSSSASSHPCGPCQPDFLGTATEPRYGSTSPMAKKNDGKHESGKASKPKTKRAKPRSPKPKRDEPKRPEAAIAAARADAFTDESPQAAFEHFRPLAEAVPSEGLPVFNGQPLLMRANVLAALSAVEPHLHVAVTSLREARLAEIFELPALVMALDFAARRVPVAKLSAKEIEAMLAEGAPWRELMLGYLEVASHPAIGLLPRERVAAVRAGRGKLDMAQDFVALPGLFTEFEAALAGKHPFPSSAIARLGELGGALVQTIRPGQAAAVKPSRPPEAILRDRFAWVVTERYDRLGVIATVALGKRKADALLPALRSTAGVTRSAAMGDSEVDAETTTPEAAAGQ